jgi:ribosomal protein S18 acetylase RimI-like enzyme
MATIRPAVPEDAEAIARVHVASWQTTYRGIIPDDVLAGLSVERRAEMWARAAGQSGREGRSLTVAEDGDRIVGFAAGGPVQHPDPVYTGELYAIYLLASHQRLGIGRRLVAAVAAALDAGGHRTMLLWVLTANEPARRFYESLGGRAVRDQRTTLGGRDYPETGYGWDDLPALGRRLSGAAGSLPGSAGMAG